MKKNIDMDFNNNYIAIWNDESHWNRYLFDHEPAVVLSPSYICPDSLIDEYYVKIWGKKYEPKIITLTKPFSLSSQGAQEIQKFIQGWFQKNENSSMTRIVISTSYVSRCSKISDVKHVGLTWREGTGHCIRGFIAEDVKTQELQRGIRQKCSTKIIGNEF